MKAILVSSRIVRIEEYEENRIALDLRWGSIASKMDILWVPVLGPDHARKALTLVEVSGILLSGGNNPATVNCSRSNQAVDSARSTGGCSADELRWMTDELLIKSALEYSIPLLGVCGGMQSIAKYFGMAMEKRDGHVGGRHSIHVTGASDYAPLFRKLASVNSFHEYAVIGTCADLVPCATAGDGSTEAFVHTSKPIVGVMWHPERESQPAEPDTQLIQRLYQTTGS